VLQDFKLLPPLTVAGSVQQALDADAGVGPVDGGAQVTFSEHAPAIPDRVDQVLVHTDAAGSFSARLPPCTWDTLVQAAAPLPPFRSGPFSTDVPAMTLVLPAVSALVKVQGAVTAGGQPLAGANVTAVDDAGTPLSSPATAQADGGYQLYLPPATTIYLLQVGPPPQDLDGGSAAAPLDPLPNYDHLQPAPTIDVALPPVAKLQGRILDSLGAPIPSARIDARSDGMPWSLSRSTTAGPDGSYVLSLRAGNFVVEAAPSVSPDAPGVSGEKMVSVSASGTTQDFVCLPKVRAFGLIMTSNGVTVGTNFQVTATRIADKLLTARTAFTTPTDAAGLWHVIADPGLYRVEIVPPPDTGLPRKIVQIDLNGTDPREVPLPPIVISPPLEIVGTVHGAPPLGVDGPVAGATVSFFSLDASGTQSLFLGSALTDAQGRYRAIVPDVAQPGTAY
jgi:hypothetical protein